MLRRYPFWPCPWVRANRFVGSGSVPPRWPPHPLRWRAQDAGDDLLGPRIGLHRKNRAHRGKDGARQPDPIRPPRPALAVAERGEDNRTPIAGSGARHGDRLPGHRTPPYRHGGQRICCPARVQGCPFRRAARGQREPCIPRLSPAAHISPMRGTLHIIPRTAALHPLAKNHPERSVSRSGAACAWAASLTTRVGSWPAMMTATGPDPAAGCAVQW